MKKEDAIEILERRTTIPGDGYTWDQIMEALNMAIQALEREEPSLGKPLTLEQLLKMDGHPVFVKMKKIHELTGWAIVHIDYKMGAIRLWGKIGNWLRYQTDDMEIYAYPPAHIDREAWKPCQKFRGKCAFCMWAESKRCEVCEERDEYAALFNFCPHCGRPLTEAARAELEKRLRG